MVSHFFTQEPHGLLSKSCVFESVGKQGSPVQGSTSSKLDWFPNALFLLISVLCIRAALTNPHITDGSDLFTTSYFPISCQVCTQALWEQDAGPHHSVTQLSPFPWFLPRQIEGHPQSLGRTVMKFVRDTDDNFIF